MTLPPPSPALAGADDFRRFADFFPEALLLVSADGAVLAANRGVARRLGLDAAGLVGRNLTEAAADPPGGVAEYLRACSRTREMLPGALALVRPGGEAVPCRCEGELFRPASEGEPAVVLLRLAP